MELEPRRGDLLGFGVEGPLRMGFLDEEDGGVLRCYDCMYETWDGSVQYCGRHYHGKDNFDLEELNDGADGYRFL